VELTDRALRVLGMDTVARGRVEIERGQRATSLSYEWALACTDGMASKKHITLFIESESPVPFASLEKLIEELNERYIFYRAIEICGVSSFDGVLAVVLHDSTVHNSRVTLSTFETENVVEWGE